MKAQPKPIRSGDLPARLRTARKKAGITPEALGATCGVGRSAIVHWETGRSSPGLAMIEHLANAVGVKAEFLAFGVRS